MPLEHEKEHAGGDEREEGRVTFAEEADSVGREAAVATNVTDDSDATVEVEEEADRLGRRRMVVVDGGLV